jgi:hypothetical protein
MIAFIDEHRKAYGQDFVSLPICRVLPIAPSPIMSVWHSAAIRHDCRPALVVTGTSSRR